MTKPDDPGILPLSRHKPAAIPGLNKPGYNHASSFESAA